MEILQPERYAEFEDFARLHPRGGITQSVRWHGVKGNWGHEIIVSRGNTGEITGGVSVLVQRVPALRTALLYAPRGPVCNLHDRGILTDLQAGVNTLAARYHAYAYKMDPDVLATDTAFLDIAKDMGFVRITGGDGFETIQPRFNYRLYMEKRSEEELFANLTQKTRYNVRVAQKHGVEVRVVGEEYLGDFMRLMRQTGERDKFNIRPQEYFARMLQALGGYARLYMSFYEGKAVSGAIATNFAGKTCYLYGASDNEHRHVMPNYLIQWEMIRWALETGCTVYDFQGVSGDLSPENPLFGLYRFKKGFNGTLDELAGEFDYLYRPLTAKLVDVAITANESLRALRRRLGGQ